MSRKRKKKSFKKELMSNPEGFAAASGFLLFVISVWCFTHNITTNSFSTGLACLLLALSLNDLATTVMKKQSGDMTYYVTAFGGLIFLVSLKIPQFKIEPRVDLGLSVLSGAFYAINLALKMSKDRDVRERKSELIESELKKHISDEEFKILMYNIQSDNVFKDS